MLYLSAFQTEGKLYLILQFLRGGDLFTRLSKEVRMELKVDCHPKQLNSCYTKTTGGVMPT